MSRYRTPQPPWDFLLTASRSSLQSFELSRLNHAANLRKELAQLLDSWIEENSAAMLARWLMENRERSVDAEQVPGSPAEPRVKAGEVVSDNFFADHGATLPANRRRA